jgi:hypothetical protein
MINATLQFDQESLRMFGRRLQLFRKGSWSAGWKLCNRLALWTAMSAKRAAWLGKRRRLVVTARNKQERRAMGGFKYAIRNYSQGAANRAGRRLGIGMTQGWWFTDDKAVKDRLADILYQGAAKASWVGIQRKLGKMVDVVSDALRTVMFRTNWVHFSRGNASQSITIINRLSYMGKIQPTIMTDSVQKAYNRLLGYEKDKVAKEQEAVWNRGAAA